MEELGNPCSLWNKESELSIPLDDITNSTAQCPY